MVSKPDDHEVARACSVAASPIPAVLVKLGPLVTDRIADLRPYLDSVPDPRSRHGRWYSLTAILLVCACGVVSGANSIDKLVEWGQRASTALLTVIGIRVHALRWRRAPSSATMAGSWGLLTVTPWTGRCAPVRGSRSRRASFLWPGETTRSRACLRGGGPPVAAGFVLARRPFARAVSIRADTVIAELGSVFDHPASHPQHEEVPGQLTYGGPSRSGPGSRARQRTCGVSTAGEGKVLQTEGQLG